MNSIKIKDIVGERNFDDAKWEYEDFAISIIKEYTKDNDSQVYNINLRRLKEKFDVVLTISKDQSKVIGFCPCKESSKKGTCKHIAMSLIKVEENNKKKNQKIELLKTDLQKLEIIKKIYKTNHSKDEIKLDLVIDEIKEGFKIHFEVSILGKKKYKVNSIFKLIDDMEKNIDLNYGVELKTSNYKLELNSVNLFNIVKIFTKLNKNIEGTYICFDDFKLIFPQLMNREFSYNGETYQLKDKLDDIVLDIKEQDLNLIVNLRKTSFYKKILDGIYINEKNKVMYILDDSQLHKIELLNSFFNEEQEFIISQNDKQDFLKNILPNIYNEFVISLDSKLNINIIEESLKVDLYCYLEEKKINIKPIFTYGEYNSDNQNDDILIKRNHKGENQAIKYLNELGYVFDGKRKEFVIEANKRQFNFLTKNIFEIKQNYNVILDEKLKGAILNVDSSQINVSISKDLNLDYFTIDFEVEESIKKEIPKIIESYKKGLEYHQLIDQSFITLTDPKFLKQLEFINNIVSNYTHKLNTFRIPKYKSILIKEQASFLFNNTSYNPEFLDYIESIYEFENFDQKVFENHEYQLREYQKTGVNWLSNLYNAKLGALLADEMGLGKTIQVISFMEINKIKSGLIVMPKALLYNWKKEFEKFNSKQKVVIIDGAKNKRDNILDNVSNDTVYLTSYGSIINDYEKYQNTNFEVVVIDEAQNIKNSQTKTSRVVKMLKGEQFIALTGTPIENNLMELWSIFDFIIPGYLSDYDEFSVKFVKDQTNGALLNQILKPFILRRKKMDVLKELPDKIETNIICEMNPIQKDIYVQYVNQYKTKLDFISPIETLAAITRLRQISINPGLCVEEYEEESGKVEAFEELVDEIIDNGEKVVVFSQYTSMLKTLEEKLNSKEIKYSYLDGKTPAKQRLIDVEKFNKSSTPVYLISLKAGGVGLNLTSASNVIIFDPWWNPAVEMQAVDRTHRIGQKNVVQVFKFITKDSIEEKIQVLQSEKKELINSVIGEDEQFISSLSKDQLTYLLMEEFINK